MANSLILSLAALAALVPAAVLPLRRGRERPDLLFWAAVAVAVAGPAAYSLVQLGGAWQTGLSAALWVSIAASMALFALLALVTREAWRLRPLLLPSLSPPGGRAAVWRHVPGREGLAAAPDAWLSAHIALSVATYGLCTLAAMAAAAAVLQERALKRKRPTALTRALPSVSDARRGKRSVPSGSLRGKTHHNAQSACRDKGPDQQFGHAKRMPIVMAKPLRPA